MTKNLYDDILWSIPEQKTGTLTVIGGNSQNFSSVVRIAEQLGHYPIKDLRLLLPDALQGKLPVLPNVNFAKSTESGSFAKSAALTAAISDTDLTLRAGDFSKNSATAIAITEALQKTEKTVVIARDSVDLINEEMPNLIEKPGLVFVASMAQLQKLLRAVYYPKMLLLSMPLLPAIEILHKFTLSYPCTILTFHNENIIIANSGKTETIPLTKTNYTPLSLWAGTLASKVAALNLWNPGQTYAATIAAVHWNAR